MDKFTFSFNYSTQRIQIHRIERPYFIAELNSTEPPDIDMIEWHELNETPWSDLNDTEWNELKSEAIQAYRAHKSTIQDIGKAMTI